MFCLQFLEEYRVTLLVGLKRHFRFKAAEGLLSKNSLRVLGYACDACLSRSTEPLNFWSKVGLQCICCEKNTHNIHCDFHPHHIIEHIGGREA
jgi:hypothetical protein